MVDNFTIPTHLGNTSLEKNRDDLKAQSDSLLKELARLKNEYDSIQEQLRSYDDALKGKKNAGDLINIQDDIEYLIIGNGQGLEEGIPYIGKKQGDNYYFTNYLNGESFSTSGTIYPQSDRDRPHKNNIAFENLVKNTATNYYKQQYKIDKIVNKAINKDNGFLSKRKAGKIYHGREKQLAPLNNKLKNQIVTSGQYSDIVNQQHIDFANAQ